MPLCSAATDERRGLAFKESCEKNSKFLGQHGVRDTPPIIRKDLRSLLDTQCPHRANFSRLQGGTGVTSLATVNAEH
jgi:hypothetical protein